ncbi:WhiB family transcriptional regulator [Actinomadura sp. WMMA1423]|uniref:WhiB family transcriptional regulator n=1 Tax=Actinomadura sp. WMMA1423 TaxID=2591108 RepID=UPI001146D91A|nr:WhiB family transcriptional regulator [Actinomadura sp. WMMA1423]
MTIPTLDKVHYRTSHRQPRPGRDDPPTPCSLNSAAWADPDRELEAMAGCRTCPILRACHTWVLGLTATQDAGGVVAAMTARTRRAIRSSERAVAMHERRRLREENSAGE